MYLTGGMPTSKVCLSRMIITTAKHAASGCDEIPRGTGTGTLGTHHVQRSPDLERMASSSLAPCTMSHAIAPQVSSKALERAHRFKNQSRIFHDDTLLCGRRQSVV